MSPGSLSILAQLGLIVVLLALFVGRRRLRAASKGWTALPARTDPEPGRPALAPSGEQAGQTGLFSSGDTGEELAVPDELLPLAFADTCAGWTQMGDADIALDIVPPPAPNELAWAWSPDDLEGASPKSCTMSHQAPMYA